MTNSQHMLNFNLFIPWDKWLRVHYKTTQGLISIVAYQTLIKVWYFVCLILDPINELSQSSTFSNITYPITDCSPHKLTCPFLRFIKPRDHICPYLSPLLWVFNFVLHNTRIIPQTCLNSRPEWYLKKAIIVSQSNKLRWMLIEWSCRSTVYTDQ